MGNRINQTAFSSAVYAAPATYPVTVAEVKAALRVTDDDEDSLIVGYIASATVELENATRRKFITQTIDEKFDDWPLAEGISAVLHWSPVVSITSISYVDTAGATQTWASTNYVLDATSEPARVELASNCLTPMLYDQNNAVTIRYVAGGTVAAVPAMAKQWLLLRCIPYYCRRPPDADEQRGLNALESHLYYGL